MWQEVDLYCWGSFGIAGPLLGSFWNYSLTDFASKCASWPILLARATLAAAGTKVPRRQQQGSSEIRPHQKGRGGSLAKKRAGALSFEQALMRPSPSRRHRAAGQFRDKPSRQLRKAAVLRACSKEPFCYAECIAELHRAAVHFSLPASALLQRSA